MDEKVLGVFLSVGLALLLAATTSTTRAAEHGGHGDLPEGCDAMALWRCHAPFNNSDVLRPFLTEDPNELGQRMFANPEHYGLLCREWKVSIDCLKRLEDRCLSDFPNHNLTDLLEPDYPVDPVSVQHVEWQNACSSRMLCLSEVTNCSQEYPELMTPMPNFTNPETCPSLKGLQRCTSSPPHCQLIPENQEMRHGIDLGISYCDYLSCAPLMQCQVAFSVGNPIAVGLNNHTCFLYRTLVRCVGNTLASASCPDVSQPRGRPNFAAVADTVEQACTAMGQDDFKAIYTCPAFTACINETMGDMETALPANFCPTVQGVMGCALRAAGSCLGSLTTEKKQEFESQLKGLMFQAQGMGCGMAHVVAEECTALNECSRAVLANEPQGFADSCRKLSEFQSCAHNAAQTCSLTDPTTPPPQPTPKPHLHRLSTIAQKLCTAMHDQPLAECPELLQCLEWFSPPMSPAWESVNAQAWCRYGVRVMECAHTFSGSCQASDTLKGKLDQIYQDYLDGGCHDTYDYMARKPTEEKTTEPTSGAPSQAAVWWMGMLLSLVLLCLL